MTRKHYVMIAEAIKEAKDKTEGVFEQLNGVIKTSEMIAEALAKDNAAFDKAKFIRACGFETEE